MSRGWMLTIVALLAARDAGAEERTTGDRAVQVIPVAAGGTFYLVLELGLKDAVSPDHCRWCATNRFDLAVRNALVWKPENVRLANKLSNLTGYVGNPLLATGLLIGTTADDPSAGQWFDDTIPVLQAGIVTGVINQTAKIIFARKRPYAALGGVPVRAKNDEDTSFFSGHTALAFAMVTSSGTVAHLRGYSTETALWIGGGVLAVATGYFRIAADAHYATDVIAGAVVGGAIGFAIPLLFHKDYLEQDTATATPRTASTAQPVVFSIGGAF